MDVIIADSKGKELYKWDEKAMDIEVGGQNEFEFDVSMEHWQDEKYNYQNRIYVPDTEYGGLIEDWEPSTQKDTLTIKGDTWRGLLSKKIIKPPSGASHLTLSGELNTVIAGLLESRFPNLFKASTEDTGKTITSYKVDRYATLYNALTKALKTVNYKLKIAYKQVDSPEGSGYVEVSAVPIYNFSEETEYSQDSRINFTLRDYRRGINHLVCVGTGEGEERAVIDLYVQPNGTITKTQYYKGVDEREALYDYSSADATELEKYGRERLEELKNYKKMNIAVEDVDYNIDDIIAGRDHVTGLSVKQPIIKKILRIDDNREDIEYELKGDE